MLQRVGFIGLGLMGRPMALRLLRAGYPVTVWNRTPAKAQVLAEEGASIARSAADVASQCEVVLSIVTGPDAVHEILHGPTGVLCATKLPRTVIEMSTIGPACARECARACAQVGVEFLDAPVTGSVPGAQSGQLTIMVGGESAVVARYQALLHVLGTPMHVGATGMGALVKLSQNLIAAATAQALAEAIHLSAAQGLSKQHIVDVLECTGVASPFLRLKGRAMCAGDYDEPLFTLANMAKDLQLMHAAAAAGHVQLPLADTLRDVYNAGIAAGHGEKDYAVLLQCLEEHDATGDRS